MGKQRLEAKYIWNILTKNTEKKGYKHHPIVLSWRGYEDALALYYNLCILEWVKRGYKNNMSLISLHPGKIIYPWWLGKEKFHKSHRQTLLFKNYEYYSQFKWKEIPKYEYFWPVRFNKIPRVVKIEM